MIISLDGSTVNLFSRLGDSPRMRKKVKVDEMISHFSWLLVPDNCFSLSINVSHCILEFLVITKKHAGSSLIVSFEDALSISSYCMMQHYWKCELQSVDGATDTL